MYEKVTNKILSIHPYWANEIFAGRKTVEYRKVQSIHEKGTFIWVYETSPTKAIVGYFIVDRVEVFNTDTNITHDNGLEVRRFLVPVNSRAIHFNNVSRLQQGIPLRKLRELKPGFHPPQGHAVEMPQKFLDYIYGTRDKIKDEKSMSGLTTNIYSTPEWTIEYASKHTQNLLELFKDYFNKRGEVGPVVVELKEWPDNYTVIYFHTLDEIEFMNPNFETANFDLSTGLTFDEMKMRTFQTMSLDVKRWLVCENEQR